MNDSMTRRSLVGPALLVGLGLVLLFNNLGLLAWSVWEVLFRLWPVLLIAAGLDLLIGRRSAWGSLLVAILLLGVVAGVLWLYPRLPAGGGPLTGETIRQPLGDARRAEVELEFGAGTLRVGALEDSNQLVEGTLDLDEGERAIRDYSVSGDTAHFSLRSQDRSIFFFPGRPLGGGWDLDLHPGVPIDLVVKTGMGQATLDLSGLRVTRLELDGGIGTTTVTLPAQGRVVASVDGGIGTVTVIVPDGMAMRIESDTGLGRVSLPGGLARDGDAYESPDYSTAENRVDLDVRGGIGNITVRVENVER